ncbi:neuropeptide CCHamide-2 receptor-like [Asterias rubens]|uniref:neuropeptide CCHamide-2 receptor-like n=1 Tax=Asterias rubens TaxID=7604 RepID=UPI00145554C8|nr:neuropeptide CCHamide-2 receptor-like [Asterias rubens]
MMMELENFTTLDAVEDPQLDNNGTNLVWDTFCDFHVENLLSRAVVMLVLCVLRTLGNGCVLFLFATVKRLRTATNALILNLALGDTLLFLITVPLKVETDLHPCWQFGRVICKAASAGEAVAHGVSVFTLTALSIDRYCSLVMGHRRDSSRRFALVAVLAIWCLSLIHGVPLLIMAEQHGYWSCKPLPYFTHSARVFFTAQSPPCTLFP